MENGTNLFGAHKKPQRFCRQKKQKFQCFIIILSCAASVMTIYQLQNNFKKYSFNWNFLSGDFFFEDQNSGESEENKENLLNSIKKGRTIATKWLAHLISCAFRLKQYLWEWMICSLIKYNTKRVHSYSPTMHKGIWIHTRSTFWLKHFSVDSESAQIIL